MSRRKQIRNLISEFERKAVEYLSGKGLKVKDGFSISRDKNGFTMDVPASGFPRDERVLDVGIYSFSLYVSEGKYPGSILKVTFSVWVRFKDGMEGEVNSENFTIFDELSSHLGFSPEEKTVSLFATVVDGEVIYSGDGEVIWARSVKWK